MILLNVMGIHNYVLLIIFTIGIITAAYSLISKRKETNKK